MKNLYLRSMLAAACAVTLAACGGSGGNLYLSGQVSGLAKDGLILLNNGESLTVPAGQVQFVFTNLIKTDDRYDITIAQQPKGAVCSISNGSGKATSYSVNTTVVSCVTNTYDLGGQISGLDVSGLVLVNGADRVTVAAGATGFKFSKIDDGAPYGITVLTQPTGRTCTVQNGIGTMGSAAIDTIRVTCA